MPTEKHIKARPIPKHRTSDTKPDFMATLKKIYGKKKMKVSGAKLVAMQRCTY
jgi:hypothetical protein